MTHILLSKAINRLVAQFTLITCGLIALALAPTANAASDSDINVKQAVSLYKQQCNRDDGEACGALGRLYQNGTGVRRDSKQAIKLYQKGCSLNDGLSCALLGQMYQKGNGVRRNNQQFLKYTIKGCDLDNFRILAKMA